MDTEERKRRRVWDEGQHAFDKSFIYSPGAPCGSVETATAFQDIFYET